MTAADLRAWLVMLRAPKLGARSMEALVTAFGGAAAALDAGPRAWSRQDLPREAINGLSAPDEERIAADLAWFEAADRHLLPFDHPLYPPRLREIAASPPALFCLGDPGLLAQPQIAIVGARSATPQGLQIAEDFARTLASRGLVVTSGLALGIDGAAHRGALAARGPTIAVCATGLDRVYPARHKELAHAISQTGLLISEFLPGTAPVAEHFPRRNRLISGLALGVLVVEAASESGSLITARLAAEQGREVFAIPGSIYNPLSRGCHQLIRQGAKLVETADDVLVELAAPIQAWLRESRPAAPPANEPAMTAPVEPNEHQALLEALGDAPSTLDALSERLGWSIDTVAVALMHLEIQGLLATDGAGRVMRLKPL